MHNIIRTLIGLFIINKALALPLLPIQKWQTLHNTPVWLVSRHNLPIIDIAMVYPAGSKYDSNNFGIAALTNSMMTQGTKKLSFVQLNRQLTLLGSNIGSNITKDYATVSLRTRSKGKDFTKAIKIFASVINQPKFEKSRLKIKKDQQLIAIKNQNKDPSIIANNVFFKKLYPNHPYGHSIIGDIQTVSKISPSQINTFFQNHYSRAKAKIVIVGDVDFDQAKRLALDLEKSLPTPTKSNPDNFKVKPIKATAKIPFKSKQTTLILGQVSNNINDKNIAAFKIGNTILGGGMNSHLFKNIREKNGWAYMIFSQANSYRDFGVFYIKTQTQQTNIQKIIDAINLVLNEFIKNGPSKLELESAKSQFLNKIYGIIGNNYNTLDLLCSFAAYNRSAEYFNNYIQQIQNVSAQDIKNAFSIINPELTVIVGAV